MKIVKPLILHAASEIKKYNKLVRKTFVFVFLSVVIAKMHAQLDAITAYIGKPWLTSEILIPISRS
uniref:Uncharacterized protein n=1 Tax=Rhizophora mucronata TaxID=61149 RepID=A0A2P2N438_RHIMU